MDKSLYHTHYISPLGKLCLIGCDNCLTKIDISPKKIISFPQKDDLPIFIQTKAWLDKYFNHQKVDFPNIDLSLSGTPFQLKVWEILKTIPYATTLTYGEISNIYCSKNQKPRMSAQAIGQAISKNPIPIIIPCHRVLGRNNTLTGYAYGIENKLKLLTLEQINIFK